MIYYNKIPMRELDGIPIFSLQDDYVRNYDQISIDHIDAITKESDNPWIEEDIWEEMEIGTLRHVINFIYDRKQTVRILDVGVGLGRLLERINSCDDGDLELYGIDISLSYLRVAHSKGLNVAMAKIEDMPYVTEFFDIITCTDVLEHVEDFNLCIGKILSCLKPNGKLILRVPNREDLSPYLHPDYPYRLSHIRSFDEFSLEIILKKVFNLTLLEKSPGLYMEKPSLLKYKLPFRGYGFLVRIWLRMCRFISIERYKKNISKLYHPVEINLVFTKI
jgi:SAM-dependent methyltransferase